MFDILFLRRFYDSGNGQYRAFAEQHGARSRAGRMHSIDASGGSGQLHRRSDGGGFVENVACPKVKYQENMKETTKEKGLWNTALPIAFHRSIYDAGAARHSLK